MCGKSGQKPFRDQLTMHTTSLNILLTGSNTLAITDLRSKMRAINATTQITISTADTADTVVRAVDLAAIKSDALPGEPLLWRLVEQHWFIPLEGRCGPKRMFISWAISSEIMSSIFRVVRRSRSPHNGPPKHANRFGNYGV